jgi:hypothetical protein
MIVNALQSARLDFFYRSSTHAIPPKEVFPMATQKMLVRLSPELKSQLEERSRKDRRTQSETLRIAIEQFVDDRGPLESVSAK